MAFAKRILKWLYLVDYEGRQISPYFLTWAQASSWAEENGLVV